MIAVSIFFAQKLAELFAGPPSRRIANLSYVLEMVSYNSLYSFKFICSRFFFHYNRKKLDRKNHYIIIFFFSLSLHYNRKKLISDTYMSYLASLPHCLHG